MYAWIWHRLPGSGVGIKTAWVALIVVALAALLWLIVFPWATIHLPIDQA
jgi:hypothetical protein